MFPFKANLGIVNNHISIVREGKYEVSCKSNNCPFGYRLSMHPPVKQNGCSAKKGALYNLVRRYKEVSEDREYKTSNKFGKTSQLRITLTSGIVRYLNTNINISQAIFKLY